MRTTPRFLQGAACYLGMTALIFGLFAIVQTFEYRELEAEVRAAEARLERLAQEVKAKERELVRIKAGASQKDTTATTLAESNNNPCNVKAMSKEKWLGQVGVDRHGHAIFDSPAHGIRAASLVLRSYALTHKIETVRGLVTRFAHGNREPYTAFLCKRLGVAPDESIDLIRRMPELLRAMARFESGRDWPQELFMAYDLLSKI